VKAAGKDKAMSHHLLRNSAIAFALLAGTTFAAAQSQQNQDQERARQAAPAEPSAAAAAAPVQPIFVDGKLAVPGAPADSETVPAKFSARNDAIDKLNLVALTEKQLNDAQRQALYQSLGPARSTTGSGTATSGNGANVQVGVMLPRSIKLQALPDDVKRRMPNIGNYDYARVANKVLLVEPTDRAVVAVLGS
jgi:hypothetical protein